MRNIKVFFDGAAILWKKCGYGFIIKENDIWLHSDYGRVPVPENKATCNVAEHYALLKAFKWLIANDYTKDDIYVHGDSNLVINQVFGTWRISKKNLPYVEFCIENVQTIKKFENINGFWIPREKNEQADELSKLSIKDNLTIKN